MNQQNFWQKNQVFITGLVGAITLALQQFLGKPEGEIDWKVIGMAALMAAAGYMSNELRGKGVTVGGFIGVAATSFLTINQTGSFSWQQFGFSVLIGFLSVVSPPPKAAAYEQTTTITRAKQEAEVIEKQTETTPPPQI
jgi:hypothetical protein